jgi:hypothetical protein
MLAGDEFFIVGAPDRNGGYKGELYAIQYRGARLVKLNSGDEFISITVEASLRRERSLAASGSLPSYVGKLKRIACNAKWQRALSVTTAFRSEPASSLKQK